MKKIILVEDRITHIEELFQAIEASLAAPIHKQQLKSKDVQITFIHAIDTSRIAENGAGRKREAINAIKRETQDCVNKIINRVLGTFSSPVKINYVPLMFDNLKCADKNGKTINDKIEAIVGERNRYVILLDLILLEAYDPTILNPIQGQEEISTNPSKILSHYVYEKYSDVCILYSTFPQFEVLKKWCEIARITKDPYPYATIANGRATNIPFQNELLEKIGINYSGRD